MNATTVTTLLVNGFSIIEKFGSNNLHNPTSEIIKEIGDPYLINTVCNFDFRKGAFKVVSPIDENNQNANLSVYDNSIDITLNNKDKYFVLENTEEIFPELKNGSIVTLKGEITRINKTNNDLGFKYKDRILLVTPIDEELSTASFHTFLEMDQVYLKGIVIRESVYQSPRISVIEIKEINKELPFK